MPLWPWSKQTQPAAKRELKSVVLGTTDALGKFLILGAGSSARTAASALSLYRQSTAVSVPVNMISDAFSVIDLAIKVGTELITDHPLLEFLKQPSPFYDQELFLSVLSKDYLITGETHFVVLGNIGREPLQLQPISPASSTASVTQDTDSPQAWIVSGVTLPGAYVATPDARDVRYIMKDSNLRELVVVRNYSPLNNSLLRGESLLVAASREARSHILGTEHNVSILENGGRVSLQFHFEEDINPDDFEAFQDKVIAKFGGSANAGAIAVSTGGKMKITELGKTPKDMDFGGLQQLAKKAIAMQYKVPLPLISDERQTLNNYSIGNLALYDQAVLPLANRILGGLSKALLPRYGMDPKKASLVVNQDTVTALVIRRNDELFRRKQIGIETIDELRAFIGREPLAEGGDVLYQNSTLIPVGTDIFTMDNNPNRIEPTLGGASNAPNPAPDVDTDDQE